MSNDRDEQVKIVSEHMNNIFTWAHLDGIKTALHTMKSSISGSLREYIDKIETSLKTKLTEPDRIIIESCIHDHLTSLVSVDVMKNSENDFIGFLRMRMN